MSLGGKKGGGGGERERGRKEGRDTRYNFEHNLFARVYICARILGETTKPRLSFLFAPAFLHPRPLPPIFFVQLQRRERGSLFLRNMHGYALSGFILHPCSSQGRRVLEERERVRYTGNGKDRSVVNVDFQDPSPPSHCEITKSPPFFYFFSFFRTFSDEFLTRIVVTLSRVQRSPYFFSTRQGKVLKYTSIFPIQVFPPFQKNLLLFIAKQTIRRPIK